VHVNHPVPWDRLCMFYGENNTTSNKDWVWVGVVLIFEGFSCFLVVVLFLITSSYVYSVQLIALFCVALVSFSCFVSSLSSSFSLF